MSRSRCIVLAGLPMLLIALTSGCNPYTTVAKIGIKVVGEAVNDVDGSEKAKALVGQPVSAADAEFGQPIRTLEEVRSKRVMIVYPVKDDVLKMFRWAVEAENGRIVALSKLQANPDGGKDIAEKLVLKEIAVGKTPQELQDHRFFRNLTLVLRDRATGNFVRVYDVSIVPDFGGAKSCVLEFDASDRCQKVSIVGVPSASAGSAVGR
jgi:hypothetical protein